MQDPAYYTRPRLLFKSQVIIQDPGYYRRPTLLYKTLIVIQDPDYYRRLAQGPVLGSFVTKNINALQDWHHMQPNSLILRQIS